VDAGRGGLYVPTANGSAMTLANARIHRPAGYTIVETDYAFNATITLPADPNSDFSMGGGWWQIFNASAPGGAGQRMYQKTDDTTAPFSPPNVIEHRYVEGTGDAFNSTGAGSFFYRGVNGATGLYVQFTVWHSSDFPWNAVSNKMLSLWNTAETENAIWESVHWGPFDWQFENVVGVPLYRPNTTFGQAITEDQLRGTWWNLEVLYTYGPTAGSLECWGGRCNGLDGPTGQLIMGHYNINCPTVSMVHDNSTWGGASGPVPRDGFRRSDGFYVAHD